MNWRELIGIDELKRDRPPRGAVVVVIVGLIACVVAVLAATERGEGEAAHLEWVKEAKIPDSQAVKVPGGDQKMQLTSGKIRATSTNVSGYSLYQVVQTLEIGAEAPVKKARVHCAIAAPHGVEIGHSSQGLRTLYPRSSEGILGQEVPETLLVKFSSQSSELAVLEVGDVAPAWSTEKGVKVEWPEFEEGTEHLDYFIAGKPKQDLKLPFYAVWRSTVVPKAKTSCTLETSAGKSTVETNAELKKIPPPINEEAEAEEQERRAEEETAKEGEAEAAGGSGE
ncbi:MAG: hypothetical protein JST31_14565 [Actinobacteria bacterium]|nr:hypothetical protein [Actinomycetota bacterium]